MTLLVVLTILSAFPHRPAQQNLGGCRQGTELGYVRVNKAVRIRDVPTRAPFLTVQPGDELRLCRFDQGYAVVTLWSAGYGYTLPASVVDSARDPPLETLLVLKRAA